MIARRNQRFVDNPGPSKIAIDDLVEQCRYSDDDIGDDSMCLRLRDREDTSKLAHRQIATKAGAADQDALSERPCPRSSSSVLRARESLEEVLEARTREPERRSEQDVRGRGYDQVWHR